MRGSGDKRAALYLVASLVLTSCGGRDQTSGDTQPTRLSNLKYQCYDGPFDAFAFTAGNAEEGNSQQAQALRRLLSTGEGATILPKTGWRRVQMTERLAEFVARSANDKFFYALLEHKKGKWQWAGLGECRRPEAVVADGGIVEWAIDPDFPAPEPGDKVIHALISELGCHSFDDPFDRMREPTAFVSDDATYIVLTIDPREGFSMCPGTPPHKFEIRLDEPLSTDELFDAGTYPPLPADRELG